MQTYPTYHRLWRIRQGKADNKFQRLLRVECLGGSSDARMIRCVPIDLHLLEENKKKKGKNKNKTHDDKQLPRTVLIKILSLWISFRSHEKNRRKKSTKEQN